MSSTSYLGTIRAFFGKTQHPLIGLVVCYLLVIMIQFTGIGIAIIVGGILAGLLVKRTYKAIIVGFVGGFLGWLTLFGLMYAFNSAAFTNAWFLLSPLMPAPPLFVCLVGGVITGVGGQLGSLFGEIAVRPRDDLGLPPSPTERVPTEELPRRKRVKRKQQKRKKKKKRY
ncbi:MAG: hypothetical protein ACFFBX_07015 [Promethearchaeota archaeon]